MSKALFTRVSSPEVGRLPGDTQFTASAGSQLDTDIQFGSVVFAVVAVGGGDLFFLFFWRTVKLLRNLCDLKSTNKLSLIWKIKGLLHFFFF